jgi:putative ABC transport system substrate-binding protein
MRRRTFLIGVGGSIAWPHHGSRAQQRKVWRVAYLAAGAQDRQIEVFRKRMAELGYVEGENLTIQVRGAEGNYESLPVLAKELMEFHPDVIVAEATPAIAVMQKATSKIPIVMATVTDPIGSGFARSFSRPGGNLTGSAPMFGDLSAKSFDFLHLVLPAARKVAVLMSSNPTHVRMSELASSGAQTMGLSTVAFVALSPADLERTFADIKQAKCDALYVLADPFRPKIPKLAAAIQIPAIYQYSRYVEIGGLMSYGPDVVAVIAHSADYVDKILKGADPADLPLEQPTKFEFAVNLKTAKSLGLTVPESVLLLADKVIE